MKKKKCIVRLHGVRREIQTGVFNSISEAKLWIKESWDRPYTIVLID